MYWMGLLLSSKIIKISGFVSNYAVFTDNLKMVRVIREFVLGRFETTEQTTRRKHAEIRQEHTVISL